MKQKQTKAEEIRRRVWKYFWAAKFWEVLGLVAGIFIPYYVGKFISYIFSWDLGGTSLTWFIGGMFLLVLGVIIAANWDLAKERAMKEVR